MEKYNYLEDTSIRLPMSIKKKLQTQAYAEQMPLRSLMIKISSEYLQVKEEENAKV